MEEYMINYTIVIGMITFLLLSIIWLCQPNPHATYFIQDLDENKNLRKKMFK